MIKTVILGSGKPASRYIKAIKDIPAFELSGIFDKGQNNANELAQENKLTFLDDPEKIFSSQLIILTGDISYFFNDIKNYLKKSGNLFITEMGKQDIHQLDELFKIAEESRSIIFLGKKISNYPFFATLKNELKNPRYIKLERIFNADIKSLSDFIFNYILYDIDFILDCVSPDIKKISASGCVLKQEYIDLVTIRLEFVSGMVVDIIERISDNQPEVNEMEIYQTGKIVRMNINMGKLMINNYENKNKSTDTNLKFRIESIEKTELRNFEKLIIKNGNTYSTYDINYDALKIAKQVYELINI